jgi:alkylated DNA repair dioxygenase AlkB
MHPTTLEPPEGFSYYPQVFSADETASLFDDLQSGVPWLQHETSVGGIRRLQPRLQAYYGDRGATFSYSGLRLEPLEWTSTLNLIRERVKPLVTAHLAAALIFYYRGERDSVAWHRDAEPALGREPAIAAVTFGHHRVVQLRRRDHHSLRYDFTPASGSVYVLSGPSLTEWEHQVPKQTGPAPPRIIVSLRTHRLAR